MVCWQCGTGVRSRRNGDCMQMEACNFAHYHQQSWRRLRLQFQIYGPGFTNHNLSPNNGALSLAAIYHTNHVRDRGQCQQRQPTLSANHIPALSADRHPCAMYTWKVRYLQKGPGTAAQRAHLPFACAICCGRNGTRHQCYIGQMPSNCFTLATFSLLIWLLMMAAKSSNRSRLAALASFCYDFYILLLISVGPASIAECSVRSSPSSPPHQF